MDIIERTMRREGWDEYTNRSSDRGGPTKWGITQKAWSGYIGRPATEDEIKKITQEQAREFYFRKYLVGPRFDLVLDDYLREFLFDCGVNHGTDRAIHWLQEAVGVPVDGVVGPVTMKRVNGTNPVSLLLRLIAVRQRFYAKIASDQLPADPDLPNLQGWTNRLAAFIDELAARLAGG